MILSSQHIKYSLTFTLLLLSICSFAQQYNYYYGNLHSHTSYSDGAKDGSTSGVTTPAQAYAFAKESSNFDFLGISEHNHSKAGMHLADYHKGLQQADEANEDGRFVCFYGMEYGTVKDGHVLVYGVNQLINWEDGNCDLKCEKGNYSQVWDIVKNSPNAFATLAHPSETNFNDLVNVTYNKNADRVICGTAVRNGPHTSTSISYDNPPTGNYYKYYKKLLSAGYKVGPTIDHDNHNTTYGRCSQGRTVVLANSLTRADIIDAYKHMPFYASDDYNVKVEFTINGKPMGSSLTTNLADSRVRISDPNNGDRVKSVKLLMGVPGSFVDPEPYLTETVANFEYNIEMLPQEDVYAFLEITQRDGNKIYTAPIWIKGRH